MKRIFVIVSALFQFQFASAQFFATTGPAAGFASNFAESSKMGSGWELEAGYKFSKNFGAGLSIDYMLFRGKIIEDSYVNFLPIRAGIHGFLSDQIFVYGETGVGSYWDNNKTQKTGFTYALGAGYRIPIRPSNQFINQFIQLSASYNYFQFDENLHYTWFGVKVAYGFSMEVRHK